jgi:hypothetical protein
MSTLAVDDVLRVMREAGGFYAMHRKGRAPVLWRRSTKGVCPVKPTWLHVWLLEHGVAGASYGLAAMVLRSDLTGLTVITDASAVMV